MEEFELRDKFAVSLSFETMPKFRTDAIGEVCEHYDIEPPIDEIDFIRVSFELEAMWRYEYADAMMKAR